jgi:hypothetical protein
MGVGVGGIIFSYGCLWVWVVSYFPMGAYGCGWLWVWVVHIFARLWVRVVWVVSFLRPPTHHPYHPFTSLHSKPRPRLQAPPAIPYYGTGTTHTPTHTHTHEHTHTRTPKRAQAHEHTHTRTHARTHTHTHTRISARTRARTHVP